MRFLFLKACLLLFLGFEGLSGEEYTAPSLSAGKLLFQQNCILCHGAGARGDGILAGAFKPSDLMADSVQSQPDSVIAWKIETGRSVMPAFGHQFDDAQLQSLVDYLRFLSAEHDPAAPATRSASRSTTD